MVSGAKSNCGLQKRAGIELADSTDSSCNGWLVFEEAMVMAEQFMRQVDIEKFNNDLSVNHLWDISV